MKKFLIVVAAAILMPGLTSCLSMMARQELIKAQQQQAALQKQIDNSKKTGTYKFRCRTPGTK